MNYVKKKGKVNRDLQISLKDYKDIAPQGTVDLIYKLSEKLKGKTFLHINSTKLGGGVAEMLLRLIPLFSGLGINTRWEIINGTPLFYKTTKCFHNALQGNKEPITKEMYNEYISINEENAKQIPLDADFTIIHDPQPAVLIKYKPKNSSWIWRCHIDISHPQRNVWMFLKDYVSSYNGAIFSLPSFAQKLSIPQYLIYPSIDPLSDKNKELPVEQINGILSKYNIQRERPIVLQVSRFDKFKDPMGVIESYKLVKQYNDCVLVLAGGGATDDPEGVEVLNQIKEAARNDKDIYILDLPPDANIEINALQRAATVILQKSTKEGFGLTVAEAMWKEKPIIGGAVGGITVQIIYGQTGFTVNSIEGCAYRIRYLLNNPNAACEMGQKSKEYVRRNFLITRHICDYLALMNIHF